jgi:large conductance mechanosensitive channel
MKKSTFFKDFKKFITRGNVIDLAVAVVIGNAFNKIVTGFVNYIIMPLISTATKGINVSDWKWVIKEAVIDEAGTVLEAETALAYGLFIQAIIDFIIIAFCIFLALRMIMKSKEALNKKELEKKKAEEEKKKEAEKAKEAEAKAAAAAAKAREDSFYSDVSAQSELLKQILDELKKKDN